MVLLLIQSETAAKMPWGVMIVSALIVILGVLLLVYFFKRFKTTETDADDEQWSRGSGLGLRPGTEKKTVPEPSVERITLDLGSPLVEPGSQPIPPSIVVPFASEPLGEDDLAKEELEPRLQPSAPATVLNPVEPVKQDQKETAGPAPTQQIWSEGPQPTMALSSSTPARNTAQPVSSVVREPYEPPRIEAIVPRKQGANLRVAQPEQQAPAPVPVTGAAQSAPRPGARYVQPSPERQINVELSRPGTQPAQRRAEANYVMPKHDDIGTLANYGKDADDGGGGRGGTVILAGIIVIIVGAVLAYAFIPGVHSAISRIRGQAASEDALKAQIFTERVADTSTSSNANSNAKANTKPDANANIWKIKGTVQNVSPDPLSDLVVGLNLEGRGAEASTESISIPVTPDQIAAGDAGTFEFEVDAQKFKAYRVTKLTTKSGKAINFAAPKTAAASPTSPAQ